MTEEERVIELANMHRCLDAAARVWNAVAAALDNQQAEIQQETVMAELGIIFPTPLAEFRQALIMQEIANIVTEYKLSSCGLWHFAHMLLHIIFDEDVPRH